MQRKFTKRLPGLRNKNYRERLKATNLITLEERRLLNDLILMYKMVYGLVDIQDSIFSYNTGATRGHSLKINHQFARLNIRKFSFVVRTIPIWNSLSEDIVSSASIQIFRTKIEKMNFETFCRGHALLAD